MSEADFDSSKFIRDEFQQKLHRTKKQLGAWIALILFVAASLSILIFNPFSSNEPQYVLPPDYDVENQTLDEVIAFIKSDNTDTIPYGEGFNCMDSVYRVKLNARWQGIAAVPILIRYEEPPDHMVIGFPIGDKGLVLFEAQNDQQISLSVGQNYDGREVKGFYYMSITWKPLGNSPEYDLTK